jgi:putative ATP-binding cassette transporter
LIGKAGRQTQRAFWSFISGAVPRASGVAWLLTVLLVGSVLLQLVIQYRLNFWSRDFFDAFGRRDDPTLRAQALIFSVMA